MNCTDADRFVCTHCGAPLTDSPAHDYMLTAEAWAAVHPEGEKGFLHDHCLLERAQERDVTLDAASFKPCLSYVNRHIHFDTVESLMVELAKRFERNKRFQEEKGHASRHFGWEVAHWATTFAKQDLTMNAGTGRPSVFAHLFSHELNSLGTTKPMGSSLK